VYTIKGVCDATTGLQYATSCSSFTENGLLVIQKGTARALNMPAAWYFLKCARGLPYASICLEILKKLKILKNLKKLKNLKRLKIV
jgi:hypothetical protein